MALLVPSSLVPMVECEPMVGMKSQRETGAGSGAPGSGAPPRDPRQRVGVGGAPVQHYGTITSPSPAGGRYHFNRLIWYDTLKSEDKLPVLCQARLGPILPR